ncbi:MAG: DUF3089 domain-containing protein [Pseudomonadota bacterium]|nr:DUF3089 domain-containing protein [Pseudomonadota bacterium]
MIRRLLLTCVAAASAWPAVAQQPAPPPVDYGKERHWLCLPGQADVCSRPLPTTVLNANGYGSTGPSVVAKDPPIDCFYVYPTVSGDRGMNSDLSPSEEISVAASQFARFSGVCRTFAPIYRQMTLGAIAAAAIGADMRQPGDIAYRDVANAWRSYLRNHNRGRPFVLVGHSQGSLMLQELIAREIEGKPAARQMLRAILPGYNVYVPQGARVGGTFKSTPLCSSAAETGCVMSWVSFRENNVPPNGAMFGSAAAPGMTVGCTNPARPGSKGWERLDSYWSARSGLPVAGGPIRWSSEGPPPTPWLRTEGLVSARCVNDGPRGYLSVRTNANPRDKRTDRIGGEVAILGMFLPGWGMHLADMAIAQGDLIRQVEELGGRLTRGVAAR